MAQQAAKHLRRERTGGKGFVGELLNCEERLRYQWRSKQRSTCTRDAQEAEVFCYGMLE
jgi:hypothetical protein